MEPSRHRAWLLEAPPVLACGEIARFEVSARASGWTMKRGVLSQSGADYAQIDTMDVVTPANKVRSGLGEFLPCSVVGELEFADTERGAPHARDVVKTGPLSALPLSLVEEVLNYVQRAPFCIKDKGLQFVSANEAMLDLCGVQSRDELIGASAR